MEKSNQDILLRAYARLQGLRDNVAQLSLVEETYVKEYHSALELLEGIGINTADFRIPDSQVERRVTTSHSRGGNTYSDKKYVPKVLLLAKLDAVLIYFKFITSDEPKRVGFSLPHE